MSIIITDKIKKNNQSNSRENFFIMKLATKDQELRETMVLISVKDSIKISKRESGFSCNPSFILIRTSKGGRSCKAGGKYPKRERSD